MTFLALQPLSVELLPAALALDQRCFGGLWTLDGYRREVESPNSELLVFVEAEGRRQEAEGGREAEGRGQRAEGVRKAEDRGQRAEGVAEESGELEHLDSAFETQNSLRLELRSKAKLKTPFGLSSGRKQNSKLSSVREACPTDSATQSATQNSKLITHNSKLSPPTSPTPLIGLGCYWAILEEAHITMLAIDPDYQRQGLGQALLVALMVSAYERGLERATLEVRVSNQAAVSLYQKFGFREAGRRRRYYPDNGEDALVLWRGGLQQPEFSDCLADWQRQIGDRLCTTGLQLDEGFDRFISHHKA